MDQQLSDLIDAVRARGFKVEQEGGSRRVTDPPLGTKFKQSWVCPNEAELARYLRAIGSTSVGIGYPHVTTEVQAEPERYRSATLDDVWNWRRPRRHIRTPRPEKQLPRVEPGRRSGT